MYHESEPLCGPVSRFIEQRLPCLVSQLSLSPLCCRYGGSIVRSLGVPTVATPQFYCNCYFSTVNQHCCITSFSLLLSLQNAP